MPDINDGIVRHIASYLDNHVYTAIPAEVIGVARFQEDSLIDVRPSINKLYEDRYYLSAPALLENVPVMFPSGGGGMISFPVAVGDTVLLVFNKYSIENWLEGTGGQITPEVARSFNQSDAVAITGLYPMANSLKPDPVDMEIKFNNSSLKFRSDESGNGLNLSTTGDINFSTDGVVAGTTSTTFSVTNDSDGVELVDILVQTLQAINDATTLTYYGPKPKIEQAAIQVLIDQLSTLKA